MEPRLGADFGALLLEVKTGLCSVGDEEPLKGLGLWVAVGGEGSQILNDSLGELWRGLSKRVGGRDASLEART